MARTVSIGAQGFEALRTNSYFYIDKTDIVRDWWLSGDHVTLICRPRRFGKTLNLDTIRCFLSTAYAGRGEDLFGGLSVWDDAAMRTLQGTVPVVFLSFAAVKERDLEGALYSMKYALSGAVRAHNYMLRSEALAEVDRDFFDQMRPEMSDEVAIGCLNKVCTLLEAHWGVKPVVLLDEYDTPMQEAWLGGYWDNMVAFQRSLFNATFKTNPSLGRALITGVTRVSRESIFSDLNNLAVITTTTPAYQTAFGFTEDEVFAALDEFDLADRREQVKRLYDGFIFDGARDIYNPWSITNYLKYREPRAWWANTSGNGLVSSIVRTGDEELKQDFETLLRGGSVTKSVDEQVVFSDLSAKPDAAWALLLAGGYLRATSHHIDPEFPSETICELELTNTEVRACFDTMVKGWFADDSSSYDHFVRALLADDVEGMNRELAEVLLSCMSSFDGARRTAESQPERFYHGLVLGLLASLRRTHSVESNRESGYGRYDIALVPKSPKDATPAIIIEFKVFDPRREQTLEDTVSRALAQIEDKAYAAALVERGFSPERIRCLGMAFRGKECLVGRSSCNPHP